VADEKRGISGRKENIPSCGPTAGFQIKLGQTHYEKENWKLWQGEKKAGSGPTNPGGNGVITGHLQGKRWSRIFRRKEKDSLQCEEGGESSPSTCIQGQEGGNRAAVIFSKRNCQPSPLRKVLEVW